MIRMMVQAGSRSVFVPRRLKRLFREEGAADDWAVVDERMLAELFHFLPRLPRGLQLKSLDLRLVPEVKALPPGLHCDQLNLSGTAIGSLPGDLDVAQFLDLHDCKRLARLPSRLTVHRLDLRGCRALTALPGRLRVGYLDLSGCSALQSLPRGLSCLELDLEGTHLRTLPADLQVKDRLNLRDCQQLLELPADLRVRILVLRGCTSLRSLPEGLDVFDLDMQGCTNLTDWPGSALVHHGRLVAAGCSRLSALPPLLTDLELLDIRDCTSLRELPAGLRVGEWVDVANAPLTSLPQRLRGTTLRWRGVAIDERIAFHPECLRVEEILREGNVERRRVMLERFGIERFMQTARANVLDSDSDAGGKRELLSVPLPNDEPMVCVSVRCPSTGRQYLLRVPPGMATCRQAVAWTAGFDNPDVYQPKQET
jgi:hypothetical protein